MKLNEIFLGMRESAHKLYVFIDEYDNFTNTILAESGLDAYNELCHGDGFVKQFFTVLKSATGGTNAPVTRLFITGVSPVTMDDVTSGFNIGTNISLDPEFADLTGFRHDDLRAITDYYAAQLAQIRADAIVQLDKYSADPALIAEWRLNEKCKVKSVKLEGDSALHSTFYTLHSSVALHRLVLVFHGGTCVLAEEV